nr:hypothetical transcript [Hymenolepis microstoma]
MVVAKKQEDWVSIKTPLMAFCVTYNLGHDKCLHEICKANNITSILSFKSAGFCLSSQVPLSNSLALIVAAITARVFYKECLNLTACIGITMISVGLFVCQTQSIR